METSVGTGIYSQSGDGQNANLQIATEGTVLTLFLFGMVL